MTAATPPPDPAQVQALYIWLADIADMAQASYASATTWLIYDILLSIEDEARLIWRSQNKVPKFLYFLSRYFGLFAVVCLSRPEFLPMYCAKRFIFQTVAYSILGASVQLSLMLRVHALWGRSRSVGLLLLMGFTLSEAGMFVMMSQALPVILQGLVRVPDGMPIQGCLITVFPSFWRLCWLPSLIFETLLFCMNLISCLSYRPLNHTPTVSRVLRDGSVYYASICLILILTTVGGFYPLTGLTEIVEPWLPAVFSFSGAHLLLSIRRLAAERQVNVSLTTISTSFGNSRKTHRTALELQRLEVPNTFSHPHSEPTPSFDHAHSHHTEGDIGADVEHGYPPPSSLCEWHNHRDVRAASAECVHLAGQEATESPMETSPPVAFESKSSRDCVFSRLAQSWSMDWIQDWGHQA